ncbi:D-alanyl-D-alanine carboxypeptidase/D-alanyl-D-alanine endopeptidase [Piscirickettsia litoralis]|uniref:D-alanyl-D-alanine carboxypeptidase/D-alanyl-D-alanine-endopeptidase n=1 Tax=Piscirickettsia litoralis TaxID=1891921 RepID=A0ABX3A5G7_9GAMM|nr:D-alanyl-D-alanine carboxypeptidase/D-alanyl-D-alanine-endopeptidase [Piscirickettsia litoralis]ODN42921.1 D-alanyl-D-alanine carboxypeptidase/D-alanyl-D-alanine-endopeptidase [Piscirickettsia litoralis]
MKKTLTVIAAVAVACSLSVSQIYATRLQSCLHDVLAPVTPTHHVGLYVQSLNDGKVQYDYHADQPFTPASTQKILVATAALLKLGPNYQFQTKMGYVKSQLKGHVLTGNVYFKFSGDPTLTRYDLRQMVAGLKRQGINQVNGKVILDHSIFRAPLRAPGWLVDNLQICYAAPISGVMIDQNCVHAVLSAERNQVKLSSDPDFKLISHLKVTPYGSPLCQLHLSFDKNNKLYAEGCLRRGREVYLALAVDNPVDYFKQLITEQAKQLGVHFRYGLRVVSGNYPKHLSAEFSHSSAKLRDIIHHMLKVSDNIDAEVLTKLLGYTVYHQAGSWDNGTRAIKRILKKIPDLNAKKLVIYDGSGLSRYNLLTPKELNAVLQFDARHFGLKSDFSNSLPVLSVDGTLAAYRLPANSADRVMAKTGSMMGVHNLVGYIKPYRGKTMSFAFMTNGVDEEHPLNYRQLEQKVLSCLGRFAG